MAGEPGGCAPAARTRAGRRGREAQAQEAAGSRRRRGGVTPQRARTRAGRRGREARCPYPAGGVRAPPGAGARPVPGRRGERRGARRAGAGVRNSAASCARGRRPRGQTPPARTPAGGAGVFSDARRSAACASPRTGDGSAGPRGGRSPRSPASPRTRGPGLLSSTAIRTARVPAARKRSSTRSGQGARRSVRGGRSRP